MYLNQTQAAAALNMSRMWVWRLIKDGKLTVAVIGGVKFVVQDGRFKEIQKERKNGR